jgi:zinc protease
MVGDKFKQEHVLDLPFSYFFPERLKNPRLADGESWDAVVDENFILIYNPQFEPNKSYQIVIDLE